MNYSIRKIKINENLPIVDELVGELHVSEKTMNDKTADWSQIKGFMSSMLLVSTRLMSSSKISIVCFARPAFISETFLKQSTTSMVLLFPKIFFNPSKRSG